MGLRTAFASEPGLILATTLHTLGAIGVVAALVMHLAWVRQLRHGHNNERLRRATTWVVLNAVLANLVGGVMRTYLPGHPSLTGFADSPWVQVMVLKHAFIFAALGALVYLHHRVAPRILRATDGGAFTGRAPAGHALGTIIVTVGVVVASALGAMAQIAPLGPGYDDRPHTTTQETVDDHGRTVRYQNITGTLTSLPPLRPGTVRGTFDVYEDEVRLQAGFVSSDPVATLTLRLTDPSGAGQDFTGSGAPAVIDAPAPGVWTYEVGGENAIDAPWDLSLRMATVAGDETLLSETFTVAPGTFFEINTEMPGDASFFWDWTAAATLHFNVHSHFDDQVQDHVDKDATADKGSFTNDREGGYSLLWENNGRTPVTLTYRVWGDFTVDSYFPPR